MARTGRHHFFVLALAGALLAIPASAQASTLTVASGQLQFTEAPNAYNQLSIRYDSGTNRYYVADPYDAIAASGGCALDSTDGSYYCPAAGVTSMSINLGTGDGNSADLRGNTGTLTDDVAVPTTFAANTNPTGPSFQQTTFYGGRGVDTVNLAGSAMANVFTSEGNDVINGASGFENGSGEAGNDVFTAGAGTAGTNFGGGDGDDVLTGDNGQNALYGDAGVDQLHGGYDYDRLQGGADNDSIYGGGGSDELLGQAGSDILRGQAGDDTICGGHHFFGCIDTAGDLGDNFVAEEGADTYAGGPGNDTIDYSSRTVDVVVRQNGLADDGSAEDASGDNRDNVGEDVETVSTGSGNDQVTGGAGPNTLLTGSGADVLNGGDGPDTLDGGGGTDRVEYAGRSAGVVVDIDGLANDGNDSDGPADARDNVLATIENIAGGDGPDLLRGDAGVNQLKGGAGDDQLDGRGGSDLLQGDAGRDRADYSARSAAVQVSLDGAANDGNALDGDDGGRDTVHPTTEDVTSGSGEDTLTGDSAANRLDGGAGVDSIEGGDGADTLLGSSGGDTIDAGDGEDTVDGGDGADTIQTLDTSADSVACGGGTDSATADYRDTLGADCEQVSKTAPPPTPPAPEPVVAPATTSSAGSGPADGAPAATGPAPPPSADDAAPALAVRAAAQSPLRPKAVVFTVVAGERCTLVATLKLGRRTLGRLTRVVSPGAATRNRLKLTRAGLRVLASALRARRSVQATLAVACTDAAGNRSARTVRLRLRR